MALYKVHLLRECAGPRHWKLLCQFIEDPGNPRISRRDFTTEAAILDLLHAENIDLFHAPGDLPNGGEWVSITSEQLRNLEIPELYSKPTILRSQ